MSFFVAADPNVRDEGDLPGARDGHLARTLLPEAPVRLTGVAWAARGQA